MKQFRKTKPIQTFWLDMKRRKSIDTDSFHATTLSDPAISIAVNSLATLAADGRKAATSHLALDFEKNGIPSRAVGDHWIILDAAGYPKCLVKVVRIAIQPFRAVGEETARAEGGGDLSIEYWRDVHRTYFRAQCERWKIPWSEELPVVTEFFELQ